MTVSVTGLSEPLVAIYARERLLTSVSSKVISQVAEFGELVVAMLALKKLVDAIGALVPHEHFHVAALVNTTTTLLLLLAGLVLFHRTVEHGDYLVSLAFDLQRCGSISIFDFR